MNPSGSPASLARRAAEKCEQVAECLAALTRNDIVGKGARAALDDDRTAAIKALQDLATADIHSAFHTVTQSGALSIVALIQAGNDASIGEHAKNMKQWSTWAISSGK